ncbi:MAG: Stealth CR1 domain-containing protein [Balneolaceae bacterium]|nr:Stealth CR1 domain-containing protein [Balneolaceae bacterium]
MKFDVVYTWVDGSDPDYMAKCKRYAGQKKDTNPERYRDNFDLIKYSIRSLERYFGSFRHLFILTARPQVPAWCDTGHDRLTVVHHDEVIPGRYLPTFNSNVIESFIHRIPGLSDNFLYMNDDFLFGNPVSTDTFYRDGKYRIFNTLFGENLSWRIFDGFMDIIGLGIIEHSPMIVNKRYWQQAYRLFPEEVERTRRSRFRDDKNICPYKLYRYYMLKYHREESMPVPINELIKEFTFHKLTNNLEKQQKFIQKMKQSCPDYYCLNDDLGEDPSPDVVRLVTSFLKQKYPEPSGFENGNG